MVFEQKQQGLNGGFMDFWVKNGDYFWDLVKSG